MADFFSKNITEEPEVREVEKIKLDDSMEFTKEELKDLAQAGKKLKELETKQGQPVEDILKSWGERGNTIGELKAKVLEYEEKAKNPPAQEEVDKEKLKKQVLEEAKQYGLVDVDSVKQMINDIYETRRTGERIVSAANRVIRTAKREGKPEVEVGKLLEYMADPSNPKDPKKAYNAMFEEDINKWREAQIMKVKRPGYVTDAGSVAGAKVPSSKVPTNTSELTKALGEYFNASE